MDTCLFVIILLVFIKSITIGSDFSIGYWILYRKLYNIWSCYRGKFKPPPLEKVVSVMSLPEALHVYLGYTATSVERTYRLILADGQWPDKITMDKFLKEHNFGVIETWKE